MLVHFCDSSFFCKILSDKLERRSDRLIHVSSIWTIVPPLIKIQDKQRLFSVHFIRDRKHVYLFVLVFFSPLCHFGWTVKPVNQFSRQVNFQYVLRSVAVKHVLSLSL